MCIIYAIFTKKSPKAEHFTYLEDPGIKTSKTTNKNPVFHDEIQTCLFVFPWRMMTLTWWKPDWIAEGYQHSEGREDKEYD